ncbi:protein AbiQ [Lachnospiraceae bacterium G41]|nr:protein AbiQ [Lachnospiraceae bacterium G41]
MKKLNLYYINLKYIRDLSNADDNVLSVSPQRGKQNRPFVGIIFLLNKQKYCIPLTSPKEKFKEKKSQLDLIKIYDDKNKNNPKLIGVLNINNMIPVTDKVINEIDLIIHYNDSPEIKNLKLLLHKQIHWCRLHADTIENRANKVYDLVVNHPEKNRNLTHRSSDFVRLEKISEKWI